MPTTACTITHVEPQHNPNEGRVIINDNFDCLQYKVNNLSIQAATGSTTVSSGNNIDVNLIVVSGVPNYVVSVIDNPVFTSISADTIYSGATDLYNIFSTIDMSGGTSGNLWSSSTGSNSIIANNNTGNLASGALSIVGGKANSATTVGIYSFIGGGEGNLLTNIKSFIGGGQSNTSSGVYSTIGGGLSNTASGSFSFIGGGRQNTASGPRSTVAGGLKNSSTAKYSFVGGGSGNTSSGYYSFIGGGQGNIISGQRSAIIGGGAINGSADDTVYIPNARLAEMPGTIIYSAGTDLYDIFGASGSSNVFASDIIVSLSSGKTVGRYVNGDTIPSAGKTAEQVFNLIAREPIDPTVNLSSPTSIQFNQTAITNVLNFNYTINSIGASVASVTLDTRRNNTGAWTSLTTSTTATTYTHILTDTAYNAQPFNYRYIVVDTFGASASTTVNITPAAYVAPTISFSAPATTITSPETNTTREYGNISSVLQGTVTRNSPLVNVQNYQLQYSLNGGSFVPIGTSGLTAAGGTITAFTHNNVTLSGANTIAYRACITDDFQITSGSNYTITYLYLIFYGPVSAQPTNSAGVRALPNKIFTTGSNPFNLNTGTVEKIFTVAIPATLSITQVLDLDALNANITANYVLSTFNVNDYFGTPVSYHVYTMTNAIPYAANHRHEITRA